MRVYVSEFKQRTTIIDVQGESRLLPDVSWD